MLTIDDISIRSLSKVTKFRDFDVWVQDWLWFCRVHNSHIIVCKMLHKVQDEMKVHRFYEYHNEISKLNAKMSGKISLLMAWPCNVATPQLKFRM